MQAFNRLLVWLLLTTGVLTKVATGQSYESLPLNDLSAFRSPSLNWSIAGAINGDPFSGGPFQSQKGAGILVNTPGKGSNEDITTQLEHGDMDLELDFMMTKGSNSGIYLQGKYEIQLFDSWGVVHPTYADCGGVYERWIEAEQRGYEGYAPNASASRAPGLWQHLSISFMAPRFDEFGHKTANARLLQVSLNGVVIHQNIELTGPTRGGGDTESMKGPLRFQGDHGPVAFRNIQYRLYGNPPLQLENIHYAHYSTEQDIIPDLSKLTPVATGTTAQFTHEVIGENAQFTLRFTGDLRINTPGTYYFDMICLGRGLMNIDGKEAVPKEAWSHSGKAELSAGNHTFEIIYAKQDPWYPNGIGIYVSGPGLRRQPLHIESSLPLGGMAPNIYANVDKEPMLLRSFVDFRPHPDSASHRVTHAISVGFPQGMSYSYNLSNGGLFQIWRGGFLDATSMWHDRGDGSSSPNGSPVLLKEAPSIEKLAGSNTPWVEKIPEEAQFRSHGYSLDKFGIPTFSYDIFGASVQDKIAPSATGAGLERSITIAGNAGNFYVRLAGGKAVEQVKDGLWTVDRQYFIQLPAKVKPIIRNAGNGQEVLLPVSAGATLQYQLIW